LPYTLVPLLAGASLASAGIVRVPLDQPTIQAGIDAAGAGDTVLVAPGTYSGPGNRNLDFGGVDRVLLSEGGPSVTIIDCNSEFDGNARGFEFRNGETSASVVESFTVRNCWAPPDPTYGNSGGGMLLVGASPTIDFVFFQDNSANGGSGGAIACVSASPLIQDCNFTGNYTNNFGSAVYCTNGASPHMDACDVDNNFGNGAIATFNSDPLIEDCYIRGNQGVDSRGGAGLRFATTSDPQVVRCLITGNKANSVCRGGGGVYLVDTPVAHFTRCTIAGNRSSDVGGGFLFASGSNASAYLQQSIVWGNCAENGGDGIFLDSVSGTCQVTCSDVDSSGVDFAGVTYDADTIFENPFFCDAWDCSSAPSAQGDYRVAANSPVLAANNACGMLMGTMISGCGVVAVADDLPSTAQVLFAPHPNPARGTVQFRITLPEEAEVHMEIFDVAGRLIAGLRSRSQAAGPIVMEWEGRDSAGRASPPGVYFARLLVRGSIDYPPVTKRLVWLP